jgi:hypothetical protein
MKTEQKNLTASVVFENRRKFPRLRMNLPVLIIWADDNRYNGVLQDISPDGARVRLPSAKRINQLSDTESPVEKIKSMKCLLLFDLAYNENIYHIRLGAYPVYLEKAMGETVLSGMLFSEDDLSENKKVSDFLFYQLAQSFIESGRQPDIETGTKPVKKTKEKAKSAATGGLSLQNVSVKGIPAELNELILNVEHSKADLEPLKILLIRIISSLQTIQETTRHIDEKIRALEHRVSRKD